MDQSGIDKMFSPVVPGLLVLMLGFGSPVTLAAEPDASGTWSASPQIAETPPNDDGFITEPPAAPGVLTGSVAEISGPKRVVAVARFDAAGSFTAVYGNWDVGGGLEAMLITALLESKRFIVVERAQIQPILAEQQMKASGVTSPTTGPGVGNITGVHAFIIGSVTSFGVDESGGGFSLGAGGSGGLLGGVVGGLSQQSQSGKVTIDVRYVNATTSQIMQTVTISEEIENTSWDLSAGYKGMSIGTNQFYKTPLGEATRRAITRAVQQLATEVGKVPWSGLVVDYDGAELYVNAGKSSGLKVGDRMKIEQIAKTLTDPATGEVLSVKKQTLGMVTLTSVEERISSGKFAPTDLIKPQRGDLVTAP
ncbi:curli biogenesis system outer membrane secretion channel CsgG [Dongia mobilis]|uniref:Curli biogenesis system outer membrane secretion channel CsgG n=2 Tax=Dongia mobilis TaxID=578943 RepID=A0A4R6WNX6_9PROT|nr:curli biogenesis system outer membrane secretion channel CsgG [Dongia mobilis]